MHSLAVLAFPGVVLFDLATPCEVFGRASGPDGKPGYSVRIIGTEPLLKTQGISLLCEYSLEELAWAQTILIPGIQDLDCPLPAGLLDALRRAAGRGARLASICSGAFLLAATGLLDGREATTHWAACAELARRHPAIRVNPKVLYLDEGQFLTSAGAAAGLDLCLHMVRRDLGATAAADAARLSVMPLERAGGQAQFIVSPREEAGSLEPLLRWIENHLEDELTTPLLARRAAMSVRSFTRHFQEQTGTTCARWVARARIQRAQELLETTQHPIEEIATRVGFASASTFRERFAEIAATSPMAWRRAMGARKR